MNLLNWATGLHGYLWLGAVLLALGVFAVLSRKNAIGVLLGVELIMNAAAINFIAFSRYRTAAIDGHVVSLIIIMVAAAEAAVGLAIILRLYRLRQTVDTDETTLLRN